MPEELQELWAERKCTSGGEEMQQHLCAASWGARSPALPSATRRRTRCAQGYCGALSAERQPLRRAPAPGLGRRRAATAGAGHTPQDGVG